LEGATSIYQVDLALSPKNLPSFTATFHCYLNKLKRYFKPFLFHDNPALGNVGRPFPQSTNAVASLFVQCTLADDIKLKSLNGYSTQK